MEKEKFYVTTPIYYVNDVPHIGHAYTSLACDVLARFARLSGKDVMFLTGTDEHGQKIEQSAKKNGKNTQEFVDQNAVFFKDMNKIMNISANDFIRTTEERHKKSVSYFWSKLEKAGAIYEGKYCGWYCVRDEAFYAEDELTEQGKAPTGADVEWVEEPSYFFALSKYQDRLLKFYEENPNFVKTRSRYNEVINFVKSGLMDLSISRTSFSWGIKVQGDEKHVVYVWLDALSNYISALGYPEDANGLYRRFWPADVHVVGKDILRFHAVYWPAFLMAAGIELPKTIMAHGWWTNDGEKISKSLGNVIDPIALVNEFGLDQVRYFLMRGVNFGNDGNYSRNAITVTSNAELANKIGNLLQRSLSFIYKYCNEAIPNILDIDAIYQQTIMQNIANIVLDNKIVMDNFEINKFLENIITIAEDANSYMENKSPWSLKNSNPSEMNKILYTMVEVARYIAIMLQAVTPDSATKMLNQLAVPIEERSFLHLSKEYALAGGTKINHPEPIFHKIDI